MLWSELYVISLTFLHLFSILFYNIIDGDPCDTWNHDEEVIHVSYNIIQLSDK